MPRRETPPADSLSRSEARRLALAAQGFAGARADRRTPWPKVAATIARMGLLQLDSVSTLVRTHYLPAFSRLGNYDRAGLDRRAFAAGKGRALFEYWAHEASLLPLEFHPLMRWRMERAKRFDDRYRGFRKFVAANRAYIRAVEKEVEARGPVAASDLADPGQRSGPWWGWHKGKSALEFLFHIGRVTTASRRGSFERVYDMTERVLPPEIVALPDPGEAEAHRRLLVFAAGALGVATEIDLRDYFRMPVAETRRAVAELVEAGELEPVAVEGWPAVAYRLPGAGPPARVTATALVSPFDPIVWFRPRTERLFDFHYRIELYTPSHKRKFGYYVLPFLHRGRLAARVDLKADRAAGVLLVHGAFAEEGARHDGLAADLAAELRHLALWLDLREIRVGTRGDLTPAIAGLL